MTAGQGKRPAIDPLVLEALKRAPGYFCAKQIAEHLNVSVYAVNGAFGRLAYHKEIEFVGTPAQAGVKGRVSTKFYGLSGTPRLGTRPPPSERPSFEFRLRRRDPFADHAHLAMLTREGGR